MHLLHDNVFNLYIILFINDLALKITKKRNHKFTLM